MNLPKNYYWIPGFQDRYAMAYDTLHRKLHNNVYSFIYPGLKGRPVAIVSSTSGNFVLSDYGFKRDFHYTVLQRSVIESYNFKNRHAKTSGKVSKVRIDDDEDDDEQFVTAAINHQTQLTKGNTMNLPANYYWIPGFGNRYALREHTTGAGFMEAVFSFVSPGAKGLPIEVNIKHMMNGPSVTIARYVGGYKDTYTIKALMKLVADSPEYKKAQQAKKFRSNETSVCKPGCNSQCGCGSKGVAKAGGAGWIIGSVRSDTGHRSFSFSNDPKVHDTEASAYAEAERLARLNAGFRYVVLKTVREVVVGGVTVTDLSGSM